MSRTVYLNCQTEHGKQEQLVIENQHIDIYESEDLVHRMYQRADHVPISI